MKCKYCKYRFSWDCDDGFPYPKDGCNSFSLDEDYLNEKTIDKDFLLFSIAEYTKENK